HQYISAHSGANGIQISLRLLEIYIVFHEVNFWKTEDLIIAVYRYVSSEVSQHPRHIGTKFQRKPIFVGSGNSMAPMGILSDVAGSRNSQMAAAKPEVL